MLKRIVLANFSTNALLAALNLMFIPIYIRFLGIEAYGLVGFFASLRGVFAVLNLGLGPTASREIASRAHLPEKRGESRDILRTLEFPIWAIGLLIAVLLMAFSRPLSVHWLNAQTLPPTVIRDAILLFALQFLIRWPMAFYSGVMRGLDLQIQQNVITSIFAAISYGGSALLLWLYSQDVRTFLAWQTICVTGEMLATIVIGWRHLRAPGLPRPRFRLDLLKSLWKFSAGMAGASFFAVILKQMDRVLISKLCTLEQLGYYTAAASAAQALLNVAGPITTSAFPRYCSLLAKGEMAKLSALYHRTSQFTAFLMVPLGAFLITIPETLLSIWTHSPVLSANAAPVLATLGLAYLLNSFMINVHSFNVATGKSSIPFWTNVVGVMTLTPLGFLLVWRFGIIGAGVSWLLFNLGYFLVVPHIVHKISLRGEARQWYLRDHLPFLSTGLLIFGATWALGSHLSAPAALAAHAAAAVLYGLICFRWCGPMRDFILARFR